VAEPSFDEILRLQAIDENLFHGFTPPGAFVPRAVYGGQLVAQAMLAAGRTVEDKRCHSLHAYFLRAGDPAQPIAYEVERMRDGRSFATRRVTARQGGEQILSLSASFKVPEAGPVHQGRMPDVPGPDHPSLRSGNAAWETEVFDGMPMEFRRIVPSELPPKPGCPAVQQLWFRAVAPYTDTPAMQQAVLAYISDMALLSTTMLPHGLAWTGQRVASSSLDHALWLHRPSDLRQWHVHDQHSPAASDARGLGLGSIWSAEGELVATAVQEGLIRPG
jgi:acyl-CoA thioesterase-2